VVILIIVILMGFIFTAGQNVLDRSRKVQAKNDETQIVTAVNAYYTEYGKYPLDSSKRGTTPCWVIQAADTITTSSSMCCARSRQ
jgi:hypothetical protein